MLWLKENKKTLLFILLILLFSLPAVFSLLRPGFFKSDDGEWMVIRASAFYQALREGQFPVRFLERLNYGYGYPVANFLYPGFLYLSVIIHLLGFSFVSAIKIIFGLSMVFSAVFSFLWLSKFFDKYSATLGSLVYLYLPYHLYDLYVRGSIGEILALAIVPFLLWMIEINNFFITTIAIFALILSHNTLALLFLPLIIIYALLRKTMDFRRFLSAIIFGVLMSSFFTIPAMLELGNTYFQSTQVSSISSYFPDISLISYPVIAIFLLGIFGFMYDKKKEKVFIFFIVITSVSLFFVFKESEIIWKALPSSFIQFPFRLLSVTILGISFITATIASRFKRYKYIFVGIVILLLVIFSSPYLIPKEFVQRGDGFYTTNEATTTVKDEYTPLWVKEKPTKHYKSKVEVIDGQVKIQNLNHNSKEVRFDAQVDSSANIRINTIYYPGWDVFVNGQKTKIDFNNPQGVIGFNLDKSAKSVYVVFHETPLRLIADLLSFISLAVLLFASFGKKILPKYD